MPPPSLPPSTSRPSPPSPPRATYRLQLHPGFDFAAAAGVAGYLADLGVSHAYLSPVLQAAPGSTHGYDVVDHSRPSEALGGWDGHARLCAALRGAGLGHVLDIVPNHMAIGGPENRWWWDVLENGPSSLWAGHFDVTWDPPEEKLRNTVLIPILGDHYGRVLDRGEVRLVHERGSFTIRYFDHVLPVALRSLAGHLAAAAEQAGPSGSDDLAFVATALRRLPAATRTDRASMVERHRDTAVLRRQLVWLLDHDRPGEIGEGVGAAITALVDGINADVDALDALLEDQNYRIAHWRTAGRELGYRRFFDINTLVGLRMEDPDVFADTHELVLRWVREGVVDGLRVDHPDGLLDPEQYFERLAAGTGGAWVVAEKILEAGEELPEAWPVAGTTGYDRLAAIGGVFVDPAGEGPLTEAYGTLTGAPTVWPAVAREAKALAVREILAADVSRLTALLTEVCEARRHQRDRTRHELAEALRELLASFPVYRTYVRAPQGVARPADVARVEAAIADVAARRPDIDEDLLAFLADLLLARLPDAGRLEHDFALQFQQLSGPAMAKGVEDTAFYRFARLLALNEVGGDPGRFGLPVADLHAANVRVQERWPATMTALSTHDTKRSADVRARLALLSEIPQAWAVFAERWMAASAPLWPGAPSPADVPGQPAPGAGTAAGRGRAARGEPSAPSRGGGPVVGGAAGIPADRPGPPDVPARGAMPDAVRTAAPPAGPSEALGGGLGRGAGPDRAAQWLLLQTLVGAWPVDAERAVAYMAKATKEAKLRTTWTSPDDDYDAARDAYVAAVLADDGLVGEISAFVATLAPAWHVNVLAQQVLALTVPGVPDVYQGNELIDLSLVDPDNRRPVDFDRRRALLAELSGLSPEDLLARADEGLPKLRVTRDALHLRRRRPACFGVGAAGRYTPLDVTGPEADHVVAFARGGPVPDVAVVVPRLVLGLQGRHPEVHPGRPNLVAGLWSDTTVALPPGTWTDMVTGARATVLPVPAPAAVAGTPVAALLERFPVAILERQG